MYARTHTGDDEFAGVSARKADFSQALGFAGAHHIVDNATMGLADLLPGWKDGIMKAKEVSRLLRRQDSLPKLRERCLSSPLGVHSRPQLQSFRGWIHEGRWDTIAFTIPELLRVRLALQWGWNKELFLHGDAEAQSGLCGNRRRSCDIHMLVVLASYAGKGCRHFEESHVLDRGVPVPRAILAGALQGRHVQRAL